jgi:hypothetical protein
MKTISRAQTCNMAEASDSHNFEQLRPGLEPKNLGGLELASGSFSRK